MLNTATEGNVVTDIYDVRHFRTDRALTTPEPTADDFTQLWQQLETAAAIPSITIVPSTTPEETVERVQQRLAVRYMTAISDARQGIPVLPLAPSSAELTPGSPWV